MNALLLTLACRPPAVSADPQLQDLGARQWEAAVETSYTLLVEFVSEAPQRRYDVRRAQAKLLKACEPPLRPEACDAPELRAASAQAFAALEMSPTWTMQLRTSRHPMLRDAEPDERWMVTGLTAPEFEGTFEIGEREFALEPTDQGLVFVPPPGVRPYHGGPHPVPLRRVDPSDAAYRLVGGGHGNSSPETEALGAMLEPFQTAVENASAPSGGAGELRHAIRELGVDPMTVPLEDVVRVKDRLIQERRAGLMLALMGRPVQEESPDLVLNEARRALMPRPEQQPGEDARVLASGVAIELLEAGATDQRLMPGETPFVRMSVQTSGGRTLMFRKGVAVPMHSAMPGWAEAMAELSVGDHARLWVPAATAYAGDSAFPAGDLVFDVTLMWIIPDLSAPTDLNDPPPGDEQTGLVMRVLDAGTGTESPSRDSYVGVHHTRWSMDGSLVDSTYEKGKVDLRNFRRRLEWETTAWTSMVLGQRVRIWTPPVQGKYPKEARVHELELLEILEPPPLEPPAGASTTSTGLRYEILREGTGSARPVEDSLIRYAYNEWDENGRIRKSTRLQYPRGPRREHVKKLRWSMEREAMMLLTEGGSVRIWMPPSTREGPRIGAPDHLIGRVWVTDLELVEILDE
jgi:FKBP-type peptidyl-prolyl cis-trans isomerase